MTTCTLKCVPLFAIRDVFLDSCSLRKKKYQRVALGPCSLYKHRNFGISTSEITTQSGKGIQALLYKPMSSYTTYSQVIPLRETLKTLVRHK